MTLSQAKKLGQENLNASFETGGVPPEELSKLHEILASGVHIIYSGTFLAALLSFVVSCFLVKQDMKNKECICAKVTEETVIKVF